MFERNGVVEALERLCVARVMPHACQLKDGSYTRVDQPITHELLEWHLQGLITVGSYQIMPNDNTVKNLIFDIDEDKVEDQKQTAQTILRECFEKTSLDKPRFYPNTVMLEASRWPDPSFHVHIFFEPLPAKAARWLGNKILEHAGISPKLVEVFPKQNEVKPNGYGNFVKLPLGLHQVYGKWSKILDHKTFGPLPNAAILEMNGGSFPEKDVQKILELAEKDRGFQVKLSETTKIYKSRMVARPCIEEALSQPLDGDKGHLMRLAVANEYLKAGWNVEDIVHLFKGQSDFEVSKTRYFVEHARESDYKCDKCDTIQDLGFCIGDACPIFRKRGKQFDKLVEAL